MKQNRMVWWGAAALVLLAAGVWLSLHRTGQQAGIGGGIVFPALADALGDVSEIRLSKGDGSRTTLRREPTGWTVVERQFPADNLRVRELALALAKLRVVERKTANPDNYARLGVESPDTPTATSTRVEVVAGAQTWSLIVGKGAEGRAVYVRKPDDPTSLLVAPLVSADPDQKRWLDRLLLDLPGASVHDIAGQVGKGPAYLLSRAQRGSPDLVLSPVPKGRSAASVMALSGQAEALVSFNFDDVRPAGAAASTDTVTYRTFDGQVITFNGRREGAMAFVTVNARSDAAVAAQFTTPAAPDAAPAAASDSDLVARITARAQGVEFEVPVYKYDAIFRAYDDLLEPKTP